MQPNPGLITMEHAFNVTLAKDFDVNSAIFLQNLKFWTLHNLALKHNIHNGRAWAYYTLEALSILFPYWSIQNIRTMLNNCIKNDLIIKGNYNKTKYDRTCWYALTDKATNYFPELITPRFLNILKYHSNSDMHLLDLTNGSVETNTPIPDTIPDTKKITPIVPKGTDKFNDFWNAYPRKQGKEKTFKWFKKNKPDDEFIEMLISDIKKRMESEWKGKDLEFIPHPTSYLNGKRWEDEIVVPNITPKPSLPKIPTTKSDKTAFDVFLNAINNDIKLKLLDPNIRRPTFEEWLEGNYGEDSNVYLKCLGIKLGKYIEKP